MVLYEFRCAEHSHTFDARVAMAQRDDLVLCPIHQTPGERAFAAGIQRPIVRAAGYSLQPGDRGYYDYEHSNGKGRLADWQQRKIEPFSRAEDLYAHPPEAVPPDTDTYI